MFSVTPNMMHKIPKAKFNEKYSLKTNTLMVTATIGSKAPKIDVGVDPIYFIAKTKAKLDITVVTKANKAKLKPI